MNHSVGHVDSGGDCACGEGVGGIWEILAPSFAVNLKIPFKKMKSFEKCEDISTYGNCL